MAIDLNSYQGKVTVADGAWGTQLQARGLPAGGCPELWNDANAEAVAEVARGYVAAGSQVIISNTFGANSFVLAGHGSAERAAELAEKGAAISRRVADEAANVAVFASMGPTGKIVMMGEIDPADILKAFAEQARGLEAGGADAVVIETMTELDEVALAVQAVRENTALPVVVSLTFDSGPEKCATMMGASPADVVGRVGDQVAAFGANCGLGPEAYVKVVEKYRAATAKPIWVKANAGLPQVVGGRNVFPLGPEDYAAFVAPLAAAGANFIGGCCGTTPEHIAAVKKAVAAL